MRITSFSVALRFLIFLVLAFHTASTFAQEPGLPLSDEQLKGNVRSSRWDRVYVRMNGRSVGERNVKLNYFLYDDRGRVIEALSYGNGYRRTVYRYSGDVQSAVVSYFDSAGNEQSGESKSEISLKDDDESGLCSPYQIRREIDSQGGVERVYETCKDGSPRSVTTVELGINGELRRMLRVDAKQRSRESVCEYDAKGNITEFRYTVGAVGAQYFTHTVRYTDHRYDDYGNLVRMTATSFLSNRPGELLYQFNEIQNISYFEPIKSQKANHNQ